MSGKRAKEDRRGPVPSAVEGGAAPGFILWMREYMDDRGRKVRQAVVVAGAPPPGFDHFVGVGKVDVMTPKGTTVAPVTFAIPGAADVVQAFARWGPEYEKAVEQMNRKVRPARPGELPPLPGPGSGRRGRGG